MANDIASLGFSVDSTDVKSAATDLDKLVASGSKAEASAKKVGRVWEEAAKAIAGDTNLIVQELRALNATQSSSAQILTSLASKLDSVAASSTASAAAIQAMGQNTKSAATALAVEAASAKTATAAVTNLADAHVKAKRAYDDANRASQKPSGGSNTAAVKQTDDLADAHVRLKTAVDAANRASANAAASFNSGMGPNVVSNFIKLTPAVNAAKNKFNEFGISVGQTQAAMRMLPAQMTDVVTQLAGGQNPLLILVQQGGQVKDSFGGIGPAIKAVASVITPFRLAVAGAAGAAAALAFAYIQGRQESDEYNKAIILTGNAAGTTSGQLAAMAGRIDNVVGTQAKAAEALAQLAGSGRVGVENLEQFATTAVRVERTVGQSVEDTVKIFTELAKAPLAASIKLNETLNYLTPSIYDQIRALQELGRVEDAGAVAQKAYADALDKRTVNIEKNSGSIQRAGRAIKNAWSEAWDAILGVGRQNTQEDALALLDAQIKALDERRSASPTKTAERRAVLVEQREMLALSIKEVGTLSAKSGAAKEITREYIKAREENEKLIDSSLTGQEKMNKALEKYRRNNEKITAGGGVLDPKQVAKDEANIRAQFNKQGAADAKQKAKAQLGFDVDAIRNASEEIGNAYTNAEKIAEERRSANLINEKEYYDAKQAFVRINAELRIKEVQDENARIGREPATGADKVNNDKKIADNLGKIATIRANATANAVILGDKESTAARKVATSYAEAEAAAQSYLDTIRRAQSRELEGMGKGEEFRRFEAGRSQIDDRYEQQLQRLQSEKRREQITEAQYQKELEIIKRFHGVALDDWDKYFAARQQKEASWSVGASEAMANYVAEARIAAKQAEGIFTNAFQGMEDALVQFVMTGKLSFGDLAKSIIADMVRIQVRQSASGLFATLGKAALNYFTSDAGVGPVPYANYNAKGNAFDGGHVAKFAAGGTFTNSIVSKPTLFKFAKGTGMMGEAGPEAIMPLRRGPDGSLGVAAAGGGGDVSINLNVINQTGTPVKATTRQNGNGFDVILTALEDALGERAAMGQGTLVAGLQSRFDMPMKV